MPSDFVVYQLQVVGEKEYTSIPGVLVESAAKSTHRHRNYDLLSIQLTFDGSQLLQGNEVENILKESSGLFFHAQGSVTRAILQIVDHINKIVYEKNADWNPDGDQTLGSLNIAVLHNNWLFIGQVGNAHVYRIGNGIYERFGDEGEGTTKLGISRRIQPRLYQSEIENGDLLIFSPKAHGSWKPYYLSGSNEESMDVIKRRLHNQMIQDFSALVIKVENGPGKIVNGDWNIAEVENAIDEPNSSSEPSRLESFKNKTEVTKEITEEITDAIILPEPIDNSTLNIDDPFEDVEKPTNHEGVPIRVGETENINEVIAEPSEIAKKEVPNQFIRSLARFWMNGKTIRAKIQLFLNRISRRISPKTQQFGEKIINWQSVLVLLLPIFILIVAYFTYTRYGKEEQFNIFISEAREKANQAESVEESGDAITLWTEVLDLSINAEKYKVTSESRQLFQKAQSILDGMELTERLGYIPAMTQSFPDGSDITRIKSGASGVYLLDNSTGNVLRIYLNPKGFYELDQEFKCTPGDYGLVSMGKIVDFVVLPANDMGYKVLALDKVGNVLYCQPGEVPVSRTLTIPENGWGSISNALYLNEKLILIDPVMNEVWIYESNTDSANNERVETSGIVFVESPTSFFDDEVPDLGGAIRIVMNEEDLYILHEDGHISICHYGYEDVRLTECEDPAPFTDDRESSDNKNPWIFMGTNFIDMAHTRLPNNSIFLLDDVSGTFYRFSLQLNLENTLKPQINPDFPLPEISPTGFGITQDQELLIAYKNQLFTAPLK